MNFDSYIHEKISSLSDEWGIKFYMAERLIKSMLDKKWHTDNEISQTTNIPHRIVRNVRDDLNDIITVRDSKYRSNIDISEHKLIERKDGVGELGRQEIISKMEGYISSVPDPLDDLDHIQATPETCFRRARFILNRYYLKGGHIVFIGDHDLTSIALRLMGEEFGISVLDVDERLLQYIYNCSKNDNLRIRTIFGDLRIGLPKSLKKSADIVFTDPPYTTAGVRLFAARSIMSLTDQRPGRILLCHGYSYHRPDQGYETQSTLSDLRLVHEAIKPSFNHYKGAYSIGSSADLYIERPTRRSRPAADNVDTGTLIYSKGPSAINTNTAEPQLLPLLEKCNLSPSKNETKPSVVGYGLSQTDKYKWTSLQGFFNIIYKSNYTIGTDDNPFSDRLAVSLLPDYKVYIPRVLMSSRSSNIILITKNNNIGSKIDDMTDFTSCFYTLNNRKKEDGYNILIFSLVKDTDDDFTKVMRGISNRKNAKLTNAWHKELDRLAFNRDIKVTKNKIRDIISSSNLYKHHYRKSYLIELSVNNLIELTKDVKSTVKKIKSER